MIGIVATLQVREGKAELFEDIFRAVMEFVRAEEPGCILYQLTKSRTEANVYKVLEIYEDQAALNAHGDKAILREAFAHMRDCLAARPDVEYLDGVV